MEEIAMRPSNRLHEQHLLAAASALLCLIVVHAGPIAAQAPLAEPVQRLRQVLQANSDVTERDRATKRCLEGLKSLAELRHALMLTEWRDRNLESTYGAVDLANRALVAERFQRTFRDVFARHEATSAVIAIGMLTDMATTARQAGESISYLRPLGADLADLVLRSPPKVQVVAAKALGIIDPDLAIAVPALGSLLKANDPALRCAAADGLFEIVQGSIQSAGHDGSAASSEGARKAAVGAACIVLPFAGKGLVDWHVEVRRRSVSTVGAAAATLSRMIPEPMPATTADGADLANHVRAERDAFRPLALALRDQGPALTKALRDGDTEVRLLAQRALEDVASARIRWVRHGGTALVADDPLLDGLTAALPALGEAASDADLRVRRAALDVLGILGPAAAPAIPALTRALRDPDRFVRWSAVRTLGMIGPSAGRAALPSLTLLLDDEDLDVRKAAADAIKRLSPASGPTASGARGVTRTSVTRTAVPALIRSVRAADPEMRIAAIQTLRGMGTEMKPALPALREALADSDARVRQSAAEALGALGPLARDAADELRAAMNDSSQEVRQAAGEAMLNVLRQPGR
jgi:HEAT repeat protein